MVSSVTKIHRGGSSQKISRSEQSNQVPSMTSKSHLDSSCHGRSQARIKSIEREQSEFEMCSEDFYVLSEKQQVRCEVLKKAKLFRCLVEETIEALQEVRDIEDNEKTVMKMSNSSREVSSPRKSLIPVIIEVHSHFHKPIRYDRTPIDVPVQNLKDHSSSSPEQEERSSQTELSPHLQDAQTQSDIESVSAAASEEYTSFLKVPCAMCIKYQSSPSTGSSNF